MNCIALQEEGPLQNKDQSMTGKPRRWSIRLPTILAYTHITHYF